ncbi:hypothetical protein [Ralstonia phage RSF1]|uniref:Uncharacterized protein n=1 Tax=Ralstonia phage RSF1 TaxID=1689679 RepID=A0A146I5L9_9CAUD|nr:hypothetical protein AVU11_agp02 [Ralstonia phage RSF1]BAU71415.1 hypothetical protein [Ralstonia phage RSF1]
MRSLSGTWELGKNHIPARSATQHQTKRESEVGDAMSLAIGKHVCVFSVKDF